jgi:ATP-dependent helicase HrpA
VTIVDPSGKELLSWRTPGRPPAPAEAPAAVAELSQAFGAWCRTGVTTWSFGDLPERVEERARGSGMPLYGHPALQDAGDQVNLTVCASPRQAEHAHRGGVVRLAETVLASELAWEEREARLTPAAALLAAPLVEKKRVEALLGALIRAHGLALGEDLPRSATSFQKYLQRCRVRLSGTGRRVSATMESALRAYAACAALMKKRSASVKSEPARFALGELRRGLKHYVERMFEPFFSLEMLEQYPRYFQAYLRRIDGGCEEPLKYRERITGLSTWDAVARQALQKAKPDNPAACRRAMEFEMMAEEYAISLFAQQAVKTRYPVSEKRLKEKLDEMA